MVVNRVTSLRFKGSILDPLHPDAWLDLKGSVSFCLDSEVLREEERFVPTRSSLTLTSGSTCSRIALR